MTGAEVTESCNYLGCIERWVDWYLNGILERVILDRFTSMTYQYGSELKQRIGGLEMVSFLSIGHTPADG